MCIKFHLNPSSGLGGVASTNFQFSNSKMAAGGHLENLINLKMRYAQLGPILIMCIKFHLNPSSGLVGVASTNFSNRRTDIQTDTDRHTQL